MIGTRWLSEAIDLLDVELFSVIPKVAERKDSPYFVDYAERYFADAVAARQEGRRAEALDLLQTCIDHIQAMPSRTRALRELSRVAQLRKAVLLLAQGEYNQVAKDLRTCLNDHSALLDLSVSMHWDLGYAFLLACLMAENRQGALEAYQQIQNGTRRAAAGAAVLACLCATIGPTDLATKLFEVALQADGNYFDTRPQQRQIYEQLLGWPLPASDNAPPDFFLRLHPKVVEVAWPLFRDKHFRQAVLDTFIALVHEVRIRSGCSLDNSPLMNKVFSEKAPILRVSDNSDERQGMMWLFAGAVMGLRNPNAHRLIHETDPQRTFEWLAFASALFRVIDSAKKI
ncbi:MAG: TIGR02391 family protein [Acidobacteria bacterium]|nr:TIGR02391 family protein [Acidobacteriota bacterium]